MASEIPQDRLYAESHEWVHVEGDVATIGITDHAQSELSDIVYVELPEVGDAFEQGDSFAVIESVKAASECYLVVAGEIVAVNEALEAQPELVNSDPYGEGWLVRFTIADHSQLEGLWTAEQYAEFIAGSEGGH